MASKRARGGVVDDNHDAPGMKRTRCELPSEAIQPTSEAIPLIDMDEGLMRISDDARACLKDHVRPLAIVSIVGKSRTGKSCVLKFLGGRGFQVSSSIHACTKGLWMNRPVSAEHFWHNLGLPCADNSYDVMLVDTEGINALDRDQSYDMRIFTLALLISSCFMYNSLGAIDEEALSTLSAVTQVANSLKRNNQRDKTFQFPSFIWLIRDFTLEHESDDAYLEEALRIDEQRPHSSKNQLRRVLQNEFVKRTCQTMVRPCETEAQLKSMDSASWDELRPTFRKQLEQLYTKMSTMVDVKNFMDTAVTGRTLLDLIGSFIQVINEGGVPHVRDSWTQIVEAKCKQTIDQACSVLDEAVQPIMRSHESHESHEKGAGLPSHLRHPLVLYFHVMRGLLRADTIYKQGVDPTQRGTFDMMFQQQLSMRIMILSERWKSFCAWEPNGGWNASESFGQYCHRVIPSTQESDLADHVGFPDALSDAISPSLERQIRTMLNPCIRGVYVNALVEKASDIHQGVSRSVLEDTQQEYERQLNDMHSSLELSERNLALAQQQEHDALAKVNDLEQTLETLKQKNKGNQSPEANVHDSCKQDLADLETKWIRQSEEMERDMDALQDDLDSVRRAWESDKEELQRELASSQQERVTLERESATLKEQVKLVPVLQDRVQSKANEIQSLIESHAKVRMDWAQTLRQAESRASKAESKVDLLENQVKQLDDYRTLQQEHQDLKLKHSELHVELKVRVEELERLRQRANQQDQTVFEGMRSIRDLQRALRQRTKLTE